MKPTAETLPPEARAVLDFWFGDEDDPAEMMRKQGERWWGGGAELDAEITRRFGDLVEAAIAGGLEAWSETPRGNLARIIVLDQFSRNVYRRRASAFAGDPIARRLALATIDDGTHLELPHVERVFAYMPLEHAEDLDLQNRCVALFEALLADVPPKLTKPIGGFRDFALKHRDIIARFGRFPYRNPVLGRTHTAEEKAWLADGGPTFGQG